jgi:hypothetical protein
MFYSCEMHLYDGRGEGKGGSPCLSWRLAYGYLRDAYWFCPRPAGISANVVHGSERGLGLQRRLLAAAK